VGFDIWNFNKSVKLQQSKSPLGQAFYYSAGDIFNLMTMFFGGKALKLQPLITRNPQQVLRRQMPAYNHPLDL